MSRDLGDLAVSVTNAAKALPDAERSGVIAAAKYTKRIITAEISMATGGDMRLSGVGRAGGPRYRVVDNWTKGKGTATEISVKEGGRKKGSTFQFIERDTSPHRIPNRRGKKRVVFDGKVRAWANHPGTSGKRPFERGWKKAAPKTPLIFRQEVGKAIVRAWQ